MLPTILIIHKRDCNTKKSWKGYFRIKDHSVEWKQHHLKKNITKLSLLSHFTGNWEKFHPIQACKLGLGEPLVYVIFQYGFPGGLGGGKLQFG